MESGTLARAVRRERESSAAKHESRDAFLTDATLQLLREALDPDETLRLIARLATQRLCDYANVDLIEGGSGVRRVVIAHGDPAKRALVDEYAATWSPLPQLRTLIESVPPGEAYVVNDMPPETLAHHARSEREALLVSALGARHHLIAPLVGRRGLLGAIGMTRSHGEPFDDEDVFVAKSLATRCALAYEAASLHRETRETEAKWRGLLARHQRILETAPVQILTIDAAGRILSLNRSARGCDASEALGTNAYDAVASHDRERVKSIIEGVMRTGIPAEYEAEALIEGDLTRWYHVRVGPLDAAGGAGAVLISADIEERKRVERELAQVRAQLLQGERLAALGSLVSGVAHELRTPLTFLSNNAFLLEHRMVALAQRDPAAAPALDAARPFLKEILLGVDRINQLVEDLRRHTKARQTLTTNVGSLDGVLTEAVEIFRAANRGSHVIERSLSVTRPVRANRGAIQQLALNLLQNAAEASPPGTPIRISTRQDGACAVLEVVDRGAGIADEVRERMFEPLYTTKPEGTGLGLSIVRRIADEHAATIECDSRVGQGATFRILFPTLAPER